MNRFRLILLLVAAVGVLALGACGTADHPPMGDGPMGGGPMANDGHMGGGHMGGGGSAPELTDVAPGTQQFTIVTREYSFEPSKLVAKSGPATFVVENKGQIIHDFTIDQLGIHFNVEAGRTVTKSYRLEPGTYEIYCSVAGHKQLGMTGTLEVS